ncbi:MAG: sugar ABC transporter ATP-binding protein [Verrucomicrobiales bacterium]|nr:sugar ABC transporter ATP-binding protein [Verrucomicrobiales bacterium]
MDAPPLLAMHRIGKSFPGVRALDGVDFDLRAGEVHVLLGENGAGKSTLMKILSGAYRPDEGTIHLAGEPQRIASPQHAQALGISTIYQEFNLVPHLPVSANISLGREPRHAGFLLDRRAMRKKAETALRELEVAIDPDSPISALGVAEQQMVEVAKALSLDARILVMDEPTSALTETEIANLFAIVRRLRDRGVGVVYISHRMEEIFEIGDRVTVLRDGRHVATRELGTVTVRELVRDMADRELTEHFPRETVEPGAPLLEVRGLTTRTKLRDVSFALRRGEILGLAGLLGSGRTELARALFGADPLQDGEVRVHGRPCRFRSPREAIQAGIALLPEDRRQLGLVLPLSIKRNVSLPNTHRVYPRGLLRKTEERRLAEECVTGLRVKTPHIEQATANLSGGNQQKVVLGKWLARQSDIFIFDEPTRGIDIGAKVEIYRLMNRLTREGAGILMISSEMPEVLGMSDRVLVMREGRLVGEFNRANATQEAVLGAALGTTP